MFKKSVISILLLAIILPYFIFFAVPKKAEAGISDVVTQLGTKLGIYTATSQSAASSGAAASVAGVPIYSPQQQTEMQVERPAKATMDTSQKIIELLNKMFLQNLKRKLLNMITNNIVNWIQNGGKPQFVTDWKGFVEDAKNTAFEGMLKEVGATKLCSPFALQVNVALLPVKTFYSEKAKCTLNDVVKNIEDFYADFQKGGWLAYSSSWRAENNFYIQYAALDDEYQQRISAETKAAQNEAVSGQGWLSVKKCLADDSQEVYDKCMANEPEYSATMGQDPNYQSSCIDYAASNASCTQFENQTPGQFVGQMASKTFGSDIDFILSADELEEYVGAIVNAAINKVTTEGLKMITNSSQNSGQVSTGAAEQAMNNVQAQQRAQVVADYQRFIDDRNAVLNKKQATLALVQQTLNIDQMINSSGCSQSVSAQTIGNLQTASSTLGADITSLQNVINLASANLQEAQQVSTDYRMREMDIMTNKYTQFMNDNAVAWAQAMSGSALAAATEENNQRQSELNTAQTRLTSCGLSI